MYKCFPNLWTEEPIIAIYMYFHAQKTPSCSTACPENVKLSSSPKVDHKTLHHLMCLHVHANLSKKMVSSFPLTVCLSRNYYTANESFQQQSNSSHSSWSMPT